MGKKRDESVFIDYNGKISQQAPPPSGDDDTAPTEYAEVTERTETRQLGKVFRLLAQKHGYDSVYADTDRLERLITRKGDKYGIIKQNGAEVLAPQYDQVLKIGYSEYKNGYTFTVRKGKQVGMVNEKNEVLIPFEYTDIQQHAWKDSHYLTFKGDKKGYTILSTYYPPIPAVYDEIDIYTSFPVNSMWSFVVLQVKKKGKWGFVGENGVEFFKN